MLFSAHAAALGKTTVRYQLGDYQYDIPYKYIIGIPIWLRFIPGLKKSKGVNLDIDEHDIAARVKGYQTQDGEYTASIFAALEVLSKEDWDSVHDPNMRVYSDLWYSQGTFSSFTIVEKDPDSPFYRVYSTIGRRSWKVTRIPPRSLPAMPDNPFDFWVGSCRNSGGTIKTESGKLVSCSSEIYINGLSLDFSLDGFNLHLIDNIKAALLDMIEGWRVKKRAL